MALHYKDAWDVLLGRSYVANEQDALLEFLGISNSTNKKSLSEVTYYTCLKLMSETMGKLPLKYYQDTKEGRIRADLTNMAQKLSVRPNDYMVPSTFWATLEMNCQHYGNGYAWIQRELVKGSGAYGGEIRVNGIWILPSNNVSVVMDDAGIFGKEGKIYYQYSDATDGQIYTFPSSDVIHIKTWYSLDGILGQPVKKILETTVDGASESQTFMNNLYKQGLTASMALQYTGELDKDRREKLKVRYADALTGAQNAGKIIPVPKGLALTPLKMSLADSQFFELKKYTALQIAGAFGIKPNQINDYEKSSYSNSETQQLAFLVDTVLFRLKQYEEEINSKCLTEKELEKGFVYKFNEKALLRTDSATQMENLAKAVNNGIYAVNEARAFLDLPAKEGGDVLMVNGNYIPITDVGKQYEN